VIWFLQIFRRSENWNWEIAFFRATPKLLGPISQGIWEPAYMENRMRLAIYTPGPFHAFIAAIVLCGLIVVGKIVDIWWTKVKARHQPRGFEVVMPK
jgi:hypothetical protein